jgi:hypothetical protein
MYRVLVLTAVALALVSCQSQPSIPATHADSELSQNPEEQATSTVQVINGQLDETPISVVTHAHWDTLSTEDGILIAEHQHSIADATVVDGILINIFKPQITDPEMIHTIDNPALGLLRYIIDKPTYVGDHMTTSPNDFDWGNHRAAYYALTRDVGHTLVIAVSVPSSDVIVFNISIPRERRADIRDQLISSLQSVTIRDVTLTGDDLIALPDPLPFPSDDIEIATGNTPERPGP